MDKKNTRCIFVGVRLREEEYAFLVKKADADAITRRRNGEKNLSAYIRKCALSESGYLEKEKQQRELKELIYQIRKIGVNINQATKKINSGFYDKSICFELQKELKKVNDQFERYLEMKG